MLLLILPLEPNCCCCCYWYCRETRLDVTPKPRHLRDHIPRVWNASGGELSLADIQAMADPACHSERDAEAAGHYNAAWARETLEAARAALLREAAQPEPEPA